MVERTARGRSLARAAAVQPFLDHDEEKDLVRRVATGDQDAAHRLVVSHLRFVVKIARGYRSSGLPMSDLVQEGCVGLIRAVRRFDPDRDVRLSTYAMWSIRAAIQDHVVRSWSLVRIGTTNGQKALFLRLRQMTAELVDGAEGISDDLAHRLARRFNTTAAEVRSLARRVAGGDQSLDRPLAGAGADGPTWLETLVAPGADPETEVAEANERHFLQDLLARAMANLPPREQLIIRRRYLDDVRQTFETIGHEIGLSKDRVRQLEAAALEKLRALLPPGMAIGRS